MNSRRCRPAPTTPRMCCLLHGKPVLQVASSYANLAGLLRGQYRFLEAQAFMRKALDIRSHTLPATHPDTAAAHISLAHLLSDLGQCGPPLYGHHPCHFTCCALPPSVRTGWRRADQPSSTGTAAGLQVQGRHRRVPKGGAHPGGGRGRAAGVRPGLAARQCCTAGWQPKCRHCPMLAGVPRPRLPEMHRL